MNINERSNFNERSKYDEDNLTVAPVVLFVYSRLEHTKITVDALLKNKLSADTDLYIYSDGFKGEGDKAKVLAVRSYINNISGFKTVNVIERECNIGLANNIINGVGKIINKHHKVIVLEDDIVVSTGFLKYMNDALLRYSNKKNVWHISGWNFDGVKEGASDAYFSPLMNCWGWATWEDRWQYFDRNPEAIIREWNRKRVFKFNLDNSYDFYWQIQDNYLGKIRTWAIFWYATIFINKGICLNPRVTLVKNIGFDGSGENCSNQPDNHSFNWDHEVVMFPDEIRICEEVEVEIRQYYRERYKKDLKRMLRGIKKTFLCKLVSFFPGSKA